MARIRYTVTARNDLGQIYRYIREQSRRGETARRFVHELRQKCNALAPAPIVVRPVFDDERAWAKCELFVFHVCAGCCPAQQGCGTGRANVRCRKS